MEHLQNYKRFLGSNRILEQSSQVPKWFSDGYFTGIGAKYSQKLGIKKEDLGPTWNIVQKFLKGTEQNVNSIKELQEYLFKRLNETSCTVEGGKTKTVMEVLNDFRKENGLSVITKDKFCDGLYGLQTHRVLMTLSCLSKIDLNDVEEMVAMKAQLPKIEDNKPNEDNKPKPIEPSETEKLKSKAEEILSDKLLMDSTESQDKYKRGSNRMGARIVYKDKGEDRLTEEELDVLDKYFETDGFIRIKSKEKGYGMKYVWKKSFKGPFR